MNLQEFENEAARLYEGMDLRARARYLAAVRLRQYELHLDGVEAWVLFMAILKYGFGDTTPAVLKAMVESITIDRTLDEFTHFLRASRPDVYCRIPESFWSLGFALCKARLEILLESK